MGFRNLGLKDVWEGSKRGVQSRGSGLYGTPGSCASLEKIGGQCLRAQQ